MIRSDANRTHNGATRNQPTAIFSVNIDSRRALGQASKSTIARHRIGAASILVVLVSHDYLSCSLRSKRVDLLRAHSHRTDRERYLLSCSVLR